MTSDELDAVCARHGILIERDEDGFHAVPAVVSGVRLVAEFCESASAAVCELLLARHGLTVGSYRTASPVAGDWGGVYWEAYVDTYLLRDSATGATQLAAVVSMADRLAGVAP